MAIEAQMNSSFAFGGSRDLFAENVYGLNNLCFKRIPKIVDDYRSVSEIVAAQMDRHRIEIDHYINSQSERLRLALEEQRKQQISFLTKKYESRIQSLIRHKDEEIMKAMSRNVELEECVRRMEVEREAWRRAAEESEAAAVGLREKMERLSGGSAEDAESCWSGTWERETRKMMVCRCCNSRNSCVIMLPCRHLCSCRDCDAFLDSCPVCNVAKKASLQALI